MSAPVIQATMHLERRESFDVVRVDTVAQAAEQLAAYVGERPVLVVADAICQQVFPNKLEALLLGVGHRASDIHYVDAHAHGGETKEIAEVLAIVERAIEADLPRDGIVLAIGGGSTMDVAGLAAQLYRRMVDYVRVPTTLIGQVDAGVGLKVGINYCGKKNIVGAYHAPSLVVNCLEFLETLDDLNMRAGIAEILKVGIASSPRILDELANLTWPACSATDLVGACDLAVEEMTDHLMLNPYERGDLRRAMDFGHTFGPTIEELSAYRVPHGFAVAVDMAVSCKIAHRLGLIDDATLAEYQGIFARYDLVEYGVEYAREAFERGVGSSIAHRAGNLNYVLPKGRGSCCFVNLAECPDHDPTRYERVLSRDELMALADECCVPSLR